MTSNKSANESSVIPAKLAMCLSTCAVILALAESAASDDSYAYPDCPSLAKVGLRAPSPDLLTSIAAELSADPGARQIGNNQQAVLEELARRLAAARQFESRVAELRERIRVPSLPAEVVPKRYLRTDGMSAAGILSADAILEECATDYWLTQAAVSSLDVALWNSVGGERSESLTSNVPMRSIDLQNAAQKAILDLRQRPYRLIAQSASNVSLEVRPDDTRESALRRIVSQTIESTQTVPSVEVVLYARAVFRPLVREAFETQRQDRTDRRKSILDKIRQQRELQLTAEQLKVIEAALVAEDDDDQSFADAARIDAKVDELVPDAKGRIRSPCEWEPAERNRLLLAASLLTTSGTSVQNLTETDLGVCLMAVMNLDSTDRTELAEQLEQGDELLAVQSEARFFVHTNRALKAEVGQLKSIFAQRGGFEKIADPTAASNWRSALVVKYRGQLVEELRRNHIAGESVAADAERAFVHELDSCWHSAAFEEAQARLARVAKLTLANLGDLQRFRSLRAWPLKAAIRFALEQELQKQGWSPQCLKYYFVSRALELRAAQLAKVIDQAFASG